jgi:hypothetical protein
MATSMTEILVRLAPAELSWSQDWPPPPVVGAAALTLVGVQLCWQAQHYRMKLEERIKDGTVSAETARRRIRFMAWFGPSVTALGCILLGFAVSR